MPDADQGLKTSTAMLLVLVTAVVVAVALLVLRSMQPVVLRGAVVTKSLQNARTVLTLRAKSAPETVLAKTTPDAKGCFEIPLDDVDASGELMLHALRGRHRSVISPVGPRSATDFVVTLQGKGRQAELMIAKAEDAARARHAACFR